jgi:hypothetical protein
MALLTVTSAARAVGKNRVTIHRYLKDGRLSGIVDDKGHTKIDTSELLRVFGELKSDSNINETAQHNKSNTKQHQATPDIATLQLQLQAANERETWLKEMLEAERERIRQLETEREREHSRELEKRLLALPEGQIKKTGWFARILGG